MRDDVILTMNNITKVFESVVALDNVTIELQKSEILSIIGENGAGKSTLMKILCGFYNTFSGTIECSNDVNLQSIVMIYQEINLDLDLSVAENIFIGKLPTSKFGIIKWRDIYIQSTEILKTLDLDIDVKQKARHYSTSIQQLICIARALIRKPKVLILDEPTSSLTEPEAKKLFQILQKLKDDGLSCIYISHKLEEVFEISDRIIVLRDGIKVSEYKKGGYDPKNIISDIVGKEIEQTIREKSNDIREKVVLRIEHFTVPHPFTANKDIVTDISFDLRQGEILGLAGLVGSGRSELLKAIFGASSKRSGSVFLNGVQVIINSPREAIANGIGFLSEDRRENGFVKTMSVKENMTLAILKALTHYGFISKNQENAKAKMYFESLNIKASSLNQNILSLSGGNQQKVILSKWLMTDLKVLFLDEPTRGIDVGAKAEIYKIIFDLAKTGLSIIVISSELPELISLCDRFIVISKGSIHAEYKFDEVTQSKLLHSASGY